MNTRDTASPLRSTWRRTIRGPRRSGVRKRALSSGALWRGSAVTPRRARLGSRFLSNRSSPVRSRRARLGPRSPAPGYDRSTLLASWFETPKGLPAVDLPSFEWVESKRRAAGQSELTLPLEDDFDVPAHRIVSVEQFAGNVWKTRRLPDGTPDDDTGHDLVDVLMDGSRPDSRRWASIWLAPILETTPPDQQLLLRFRVILQDPRSGITSQVCSEPFPATFTAPSIPNSLKAKLCS